MVYVEWISRLKPRNDDNITIVCHFDCREKSMNKCCYVDFSFRFTSFEMTVGWEMNFSLRSEWQVLCEYVIQRRNAMTTKNPESLLSYPGSSSSNAGQAFVQDDNMIHRKLFAALRMTYVEINHSVASLS